MLNLTTILLLPQPLVDPKLDGGQAECEQAMRKQEMDEKVAALHAAKAFKEFITANRRGTMPTFLEPVNLKSPLASSGRRRPQS